MVQTFEISEKTMKKLFLGLGLLAGACARADGTCDEAQVSAMLTSVEGYDPLDVTAPLFRTLSEACDVPPLGLVRHDGTFNPRRFGEAVASHEIVMKDACPGGLEAFAAAWDASDPLTARRQVVDECRLDRFGLSDEDLEVWGNNAVPRIVAISVADRLPDQTSAAVREILKRPVPHEEIRVASFELSVQSPPTTPVIVSVSASFRLYGLALRQRGPYARVTCEVDGERWIEEDVLIGSYIPTDGVYTFAYEFGVPEGPMPGWRSLAPTRCQADLMFAVSDGHKSGATICWSPDQTLTGACNFGEPVPSGRFTISPSHVHRHRNGEATHFWFKVQAGSEAGTELVRTFSQLTCPYGEPFPEHQLAPWPGRHSVWPGDRMANVAPVDSPRTRVPSGYSHPTGCTQRIWVVGRDSGETVADQEFCIGTADSISQGACSN